jgi:hypothetical protein
MNSPPNFERAKSLNLEKIKSKLIEEFECIEAESKCLQTFQNELDLLTQEKMAHLEELRQIQSDIASVSDKFEILTELETS